MQITRHTVLVSLASLGAALLLALALWVTTAHKPKTTARQVTFHSVSADQRFLQQAGQSLLQAHQEDHGGWRFPSAIQAPHYQTDRDVGAAGIGMGFLALAQQHPDDPQWLNATEQTANWLLAVGQRDSAGNLYWSDYVDDGSRSDSVYTSFDDGTLGISDFLWQLSEKSSDIQYRKAAESSLQWVLANAEQINSQSGQPMYRWKWDVGQSQDGPVYNMGMGMGAVGIVNTLTTYYQRFKNTNPAMAETCRQYIAGSLRYIDQVRGNLASNDGDIRALPETGVIGNDGDTTMNSGYLSGAAGAAYMYLNLYKTFKEPAYLAQAQQLFSWLEDTKNGPMVTFNDGTVAWKLAIDPQDDSSNKAYATGFEEGSAGIAWVYLQAYKVTGSPHYLAVAKKAAGWLQKVGVKDHGGLAWHEDENPTKPVLHANLNNGAAGIGMFFWELHEVVGAQAYAATAQDTLAWIKNTALTDAHGNLYWKDNDGDNDYSNDPSWHWGTAGIVELTSRMTGGPLNIPGEQPAL